MTERTPPIGCADVRSSLAAFTADELPVSDSRRIQEHLDRCPPCEGFRRFESAFDAALERTVRSEAAPASLMARIHRALDAEDAGGSPSSSRVLARPWARWALAASLAVAVIVPAAMALRGGFIRLPLSAAGALRSAEGMLVCAECARNRIPIERQRGCRAHGHHSGFRTDDGRIWEFVDTDRTRQLITEAGRIGDRLEVKGLFIEEIHYVEVGSYRYTAPGRGARRGA